MAWNEPGDNKSNSDNNNEKDPWSGRDRKSPSKPKDLDDALKKLQDKFSAFFKQQARGKNSGNAGGNGSGNDGNSGKGGNKSGSSAGAFFGVGFIFIAILVIWGITGFYTVQQPQRAVVLRFGQYTETVGAGLHWLPRFIESEYKVNIQKIYSYTYPPQNDALMLTKDQNIVAVGVTVQFRVGDPKNYLFNVVNPVDSLRQATASALRQVVGKMTLDNILTTQREALRSAVRKQLDVTLVRYKAGLTVVSVLLKSAKAPDAVRAAFDDAVKAQEDEKRYVNQAQAYAMKVEPIAKGKAQRILAASKAYKQQVVLQAQARTAPYLALLPEYKKAPGVTRERLYLTAIENVLQHSSKILMNASGSNNLLYLPLNKLMDQTSANIKTGTAGTFAANTQTDSVAHVPLQNQTVTTRTQRPGRDNIPLSGY